MSKKTLAYIIQGALLLAVVIIGVITYKSVERDQKALEKRLSPVGHTAACPPSQRRTCTEESYSTKPVSCTIRRDECNSQNDLKFCFIYTWKEGKSNGDCHDCDGANLENSSNRVFTECNGSKEKSLEDNAPNL